MLESLERIFYGLLLSATGIFWSGCVTKNSEGLGTPVQEDLQTLRESPYGTGLTEIPSLSSDEYKAFALTLVNTSSSWLRVDQVDISIPGKTGFEYLSDLDVDDYIKSLEQSHPSLRSSVRFKDRTLIFQDQTWQTHYLKGGKAKVPPKMNRTYWFLVKMSRSELWPEMVVSLLRSDHQIDRFIVKNKEFVHQFRQAYRESSLYDPEFREAYPRPQDYYEALFPFLKNQKSH
ncbi:MAG: hypothetical protein HRU19_23610 [Pseudobacteriovorax sp.]|nr:hypothetical protein [Pseudobacteriovorax sp.]